jgi:D-arginine dehydrogenase
MTDFDIAVIGAGMAGASIASELSRDHSVVIVEAEAQPGFHATGRSVAFWTESYGGPLVQPLTSASGDFLWSPPKEFSDTGFLTKRGALHIGKAEQEALADELLKDFAGSMVRFEKLGHPMIAERLSGIGAEWSEGIWEADCCDIDVSALHSAYLQNAKSNGAVLVCNSLLQEARYQSGAWQITTARDNLSAHILVNAAGAWADQVASLCGISKVGITPFRRTVLQVQTDMPIPASAPLVIALDGSFYFKPNGGGQIWLSPHDETPSPACDAVPEELDIALAIDRFENIGAWKIKKIERKWAGLRSFAPDRLPVIGPDRSNPKFFWAAGQGGFGIQTAPAISILAAALVRGEKVELSGVDPNNFLPDRFA